MSAPEGSETVSLPMAGFPGRWLETLCFLISFTPSTSQHWTRSGGGWGGGQFSPRPLGGGQRPQTMAGARPAWHGRWKSVAGLQRGDGWFHFPSFRPLQAGITSDSAS